MRLRSVLVLTRDMESSLRFWRDSLRLPVLSVSDVFCELDLGEKGVSLALKSVEYSEAMMSSGYTPQLLFEVENFDAVLYALLASQGRLDGPVKVRQQKNEKRKAYEIIFFFSFLQKHSSNGKVASLRSVDNVMISLIEKSAQ